MALAVSHALLERGGQADASHLAGIQLALCGGKQDLLVHFPAIAHDESIQRTIQWILEQAHTLGSKSQRHGTRANFGKCRPLHVEQPQAVVGGVHGGQHRCLGLAQRDVVGHVHGGDFAGGGLAQTLAGKIVDLQTAQCGRADDVAGLWLCCIAHDHCAVGFPGQGGLGLALGGELGCR